MKKTMNYLIYLLVIFFVIYISPVRAGGYDFDISPGDEITLNFDQYLGINCTPVNFIFLEASNMVISTESITEEGKEPVIVQKSASMFVSYKLNAFPEEDARVETLKCTFERDVQKGTENGEFDVNFTIRPYATDVDNLIIIYGYNPAWDIFRPIYENDYMIENLKSVTKITNSSNAGKANEYIDINCPAGTETSCVFSANSKYNPDEGNAIAYYDIEYRDTFDRLHTASFTITIQPNKFIYADYMSFSSCSFGSAWSKTELSTRMKADLKVGSKISLPNCSINPGNNPLFKFHGWIDLSRKDSNGNPFSDHVNSMQMDACSAYPVDSNPTLTQDSKYFYSCYISRRGIALHPDGGRLSSTSGSTTIDDVVYFPVDGNFTLPRVTSIPQKYSIYSDAKFYGWKGPDGNICNPNETTCTVPADGGHYFAVFSNNGLSINDAQSIIVYEEETEPIILPVDVTSCTENSENIDVEISGGQCFVFGHASTNDEYVDVTVVAGEQTFIYKVKVAQREGNFNNWMDDAVLELDNNADYGIVTEGDSISNDGSTLCSEYVVSNSGITIKNVAKSKYNNFKLSFHQYRAVSKCDSNMVHLALCMDPGRPGPSSDIYVVDDSFNFDNEFGKMLNHIVKEFVREGISKDDTSTNAKNKIAAANIAVRLAQYFSTEELANTGNNANNYLINALNAYKAAGQKLYQNCSGNLESCSDTIIENTLKDVWEWQPSSIDILNNAVAYLSSYENTEVVAEINEVKSEYIQEPVQFNPNSLYFKYEGKLTNFGSDVNYNTLQLTKDCEKICSGSSCCNLTYNLVGNEFHYTFTFTLSEENMKKISSLTASERPAIVLSSSESGYKAANVFVLKPQNGNRQRMAIFNLEGAKKRFPFELTTHCDLSYPTLNPENSRFNPVLFREMGCCEKVKGDAAYEETYKYYCSQFCYSSNFQMYCNPNKVGATDNIDSYSIKEGKIGATGQESFFCLVDVTADTNKGKTETRKKVDYAGNRYANSAAGIASNKYCVVSCREEWDMSLPGFDNFLGTNAINAGGFFSIDKYLYFNTKRSCYSTFIDYETYVSDQQTLSKQAVKAYTEHSEYTQVYSILDASRSTDTLTYKKWYYNSSEDYKCHSNDGCARRESYSCPTESNPNKTCSRCAEWIPCQHVCHNWKSTEHTCTVYTIDTYSSRSYDANEYETLDPTGDYQNIKQGKNKNNSWQTLTSSLGSISGRTIGGGSKVYSYHKVGSRPAPNQHSTTSYNEGSCCGGGGYYNCPYGTVGYEQLLNDVTYRGKNVKTNINNQANIVKNRTNSLKSNAQNMSKCQNFYLQNESSKNTWNAVDTTKLAYGGKKLFENTTIITNGSPSTKILSNFEPEASYEYEEHFFMAELGKERNSNVIIPFVEENEKYYGGTSGCGGSINRVNAYGETLYICRGKTEEKAYNPQGQDYEWTPEREGPTYTGPGYTPVSDALIQYKIPLCITTEPGVYHYQGVSANKKCETSLAVVYEFNYLTRSLQNSSFYVNKGHWYVDSVNDIKGHGDTASQAVSNNGAGMKTLTTDLFGAKYNTFPIGLNTPRNVYQYEYAFKGIGIYPNNSDTSRIMGDEKKSMIKQNVRKCFYEVFEDLCRCCGDPIVWYTHSTSKINDTDDYFQSINYDFDPSKDNYNNRTSNFGPKTSTVSLFDVNGTNNRTLGDNWSSSDPYYFVGNLYYTSKGSELLKHINAKGDTIYNNTGDLIPEYSYTLTPALLAQIRGNNVKYGYSSDTVHVINKICYASGLCPTDSTDHGFYHFGSKFLEEFLSKAETPGFTSIINGSSGTSTCTVTDASSGFSRSCRFVDYKTSNGHYLALK